MARLLFTHSYFMRLDSKQWNHMQPYPPLMTITAASLMRANGHQVALHDVMFASTPESIHQPIGRFQPHYLVIFDDGFNYLTKMCLTNMREAAFRMASIASAAGIKVIVCSSDSTDHYEAYLRNGADFVLLGEGEVSLLELVTALENHENSAPPTPGLAYVRAGEVVQTGKREALRDLDMLPMAAWDLIDMDAYKRRWLEKNGYFSLNIATTRGCPFKCNWCAKPIYGNRYNSRSPEKVVDEMAYLLEHYQPDHFWMCDDIYGLKPGWVQRFAALVEERGLKFSYKIQSRVDLLLKEDALEALARSGCETIWVGAESGSQKILDAMDKGTTVQQIKEASLKMKAFGIKPAFFLQFGYLGETKEDIQATIDLLLECMPHDIGISVSYPLPGTPFYEKVKAELGQKANWTDSDDLAMMFRNNFKPNYYRVLHRYVHKVFRLKQAYQSLGHLLQRPAGAGRSELRRIVLGAYYLPASLIDKVQLLLIEKSSA